ncbi:hypothetical protein C9374_011472 [Naegleria lovaniensis]|uniref:Uncharacterized protein n=1 Tax=Naegleria lovaniensis TaxID=51637 RepID=A0AA88H487_NAELO|nr:uncharacterized protein C9374_011472 [Naegleria lovaniensis]KAG2392747.1 hypothetical protein C9374_011472 [Naegleria lovaniensis]
MISAQDYSSGDDDEDDLQYQQDHQFLGIASGTKDLSPPPSSVASTSTATTSSSDPATGDSSLRFHGISSSSQQQSLHTTTPNQDQQKRGVVYILLLPYLCFIEGFSNMVRWMTGGGKRTSSSTESTGFNNEDLSLQSEGYSQV